jgi:hypothetical protein
MDERLRRGGFEFRPVKLQPWKVWALAAIGGALAVTVLITMAGLLLILVPVLLVGGFVARLLLGGTTRPATGPRPAPGRPEVIEGRYEVVEVNRSHPRAEKSQPD